MKHRILVTRPEPGAGRTAERLRAAGFDPVVLPLTRIEQQKFEIPRGSFDGIIVTSAQALRGDFSRFAHLQLIAVGETTAKAARAAGFTAIITAGGSAESVAGRAVSELKREGRLLYICGEVRRPELEELLGEAGFQVESVETYRAVAVHYEPDQSDGALGSRPIDAVVLMSAVTAKLFRNFARLPQLHTALLVCFSQRIAEEAKALGMPVTVTEEATEDALLKLLKLQLP